MLSMSVVKDIYGIFCLRLRTSSAWVLLWPCSWLWEGSGLVSAATRTTSCPPPSAGGSSTSSIPQTPWSVSLECPKPYRRYLSRTQACNTKTSTFTSPSYVPHTDLGCPFWSRSWHFFNSTPFLPHSAEYQNWEWALFTFDKLEKVKTCVCTKLTEVVLVCSGLQTGAPHPQTLQQCCTCSDTLVRASVF